ncbi:MAG TPA: hypothetical protein VHE59_02955 [Mucilaginibacter sp.]|nr:hypothetical protein [Mucilaginibacter sp.]
MTKKLPGFLFAVILFLVLGVSRSVSAQIKADTVQKAVAAPPPAVKASYPKAVGYVSFIIPLVSANRDAATWNFNGSTSIGFPVGVNVLYSDKFGFSYEFTPTIKWSGGNSKASNLLFDPGTMFRFQHGFTIITRLAFETSGRYGFTPVFNQVYARTKDVNYFIALSLPGRFGNSQLPTIGLNLQLGFTFN